MFEFEFDVDSCLYFGRRFILGWLLGWRLDSFDTRNELWYLLEYLMSVRQTI